MTKIFQMLSLFIALALWLVLGGIYASYCFTTSWACFFKTTYFFIILVAFLVGLCLKHNRVPWSTFGGLFLCGIGLLISTWTSEFPVRAASELDIIFAAVGLAYLVTIGLRTNFVVGLRAIGLTLFALTHFSIALYAACEYYTQQDYPWETLFQHTLFNLSAIWQSVFHPHGLFQQVFSYSNFAALFASMLCPFFAGLWIWERSKLWKCLWTLALAWAIGLLKLGDSNSGYLCLLIAISVIFLDFLIQQFRHFHWKSFVVVCLLVVLIGWALWHFNREVRNSLLTISHGKIKALLGMRYTLGMDGLTLFKEHPWFGFGGTTTPLYYLKATPILEFPNWHLHMNPVQLLLEFGSVTCLGLCILVGAYLRMAYKVLHSTYTSTREKGLAYGILGSFIVYMTFFTDCSWAIFVLPGTFCLIASILFVIREKNNVSKSSIQGGASYILVLLALLLIGTIFYSSNKEIRGRYAFDRFLYAARYVPQTAVEKLEEAIKIYPNNLYFYNQGANVFASMSSPYDLDSQWLAIHYFEKSLCLDPWQVFPHENLGTLYERCGRPVEAVQHYLADMELLPLNSLSYIQLVALLRVRCPESDLVDQWLGLAVFNAPRLLEFGYFNRWYLESPKAQMWTKKYYERCQISWSLPGSLQGLIEKTDETVYTFFPQFYPEDAIKYNCYRFALRGSNKDPNFMIQTLVPLVIPRNVHARWGSLDERTYVRELKEQTITAVKEAVGSY